MGGDLAGRQLFQRLVAGRGGMDLLLDLEADHAPDLLLHIHAVQHLHPLAIDQLPLMVHYIVIFQNRLSGLIMDALHPGLGALDGVGEDTGVDGLVLGDLQGGDDGLHPAAAEAAHQIVLQRKEEGAFARVALAARPAPELIVDAAGLVALGADDAEPARLPDPVRVGADALLILLQLLAEQRPGLQDLGVVRLGIAGGLRDDLIGIARSGQLVLGHIGGVAAQHDVRAAARHVGGDGNGAGAARLGHDHGLLVVVLGVKHLMLDALPLQQGGKQLALFDGDRAHQHRLFLFVAGPDLAEDGLILALFREIDLILMVLADHGPVGGDLDHIQRIGPPKLRLLREGRTGHTGELGIHPEVILEGDGGQRPALPLDLHALLGLDSLMQALGIAAAQHQAAGELIHDDDLPVLDYIVGVPLHTAVGLDGLIDMVQQGGVFRVGKVAAAEILLRLGHAPGGDGGGVCLFVHDIIGGDVLLALLFVHLHQRQGRQRPGKELRLPVKVGGFVALAGDDQRRPGFIDEDGVHLVHHGEVEGPLDHVLLEDAHIVPQVVEAHLVVGAVGHIGGIGRPALLLIQIVDDDAAGKAHEAVNIAHHLALVFGQIIVDGDDMHALARQPVEIGGQGGGQGLALAGLHFGDAALMEDDAADELHPEGKLAQHPPVGLPHGGKGLGQQLVQRLALGQPLPEPGGLGLELGVCQGGIFRLQRLDPVHQRLETADLPGGGVAEKLFHQTGCHCKTSFQKRNLLKSFSFYHSFR